MPNQPRKKKAKAKRPGARVQQEGKTGAPQLPAQQQPVEHPVSQAALGKQPTLEPPREIGRRDDGPRRPILIDPKLKASALAVASAWSVIEIDDVHNHNLLRISLKFGSTAAAQAALANAKEFIATVYNELDRPRYSLPDDVVLDGFSMRYEVFLPSIFQVLADDIDQTPLSSLAIPDALIRAANLYVRVFAGPGFIRAWLPLEAEGQTSPERADCFARIQETQAKLLPFLKQLISRASSHHVQIDANLQVTVDGKAFEGKGTAKRALFCLALLRDKQTFSTSEFSKFFYGKDAGTGAKDFQNGIREIKCVLPFLEHKSEKNARTIKGVAWDVGATPDQLQNFLAKAHHAA
jgi:hypothetical protein